MLKEPQRPPSVKDQYLAALLAQPAVATVPIAGEKSVPVEQIYVQRTLLQEVKQKKSDRETERDARRSTSDADAEREITVKVPVELWSKLHKQRVLLIEGPAGMGKSTLSKQLVRESAAQQHLIPIWIACRDWIGSRLTLTEYLEQRYVPALGLSGIRVPYKATGDGPDRSLGQWIYEQWFSGLGVLILDGLDEVFVHRERVEALKTLPITGTGLARPATILTSRPLSQAVPLHFTLIELQGLTPPEQTHLSERYRATLQLSEEQLSGFQRKVERNTQGRVLELLTRPGHLVEILSTYARTGILPTTETQVFEQLLQSRLTITGRSQPPVDPEDPTRKQQVLASLALHLLACRHGQRQTRAQLLALIRQVLHEQASHGQPLFSFAQATGLLHDFVRNSGLLTEVEPEVYQFETVIWLQHLTGCALANEHLHTAVGLTDEQVLEFLDKKAWDPEWEPVLKSLVGTAQNPFPWFISLIDKHQDDLARHRLGTAGRCLEEVRPELRADPHYEDLAVQIPTEAFAVWKAEAELGTVEYFGTEVLVESSLRGAWIETGAGQAMLMELFTHKNAVLRQKAVWALGGLSAAMPQAVQQALVKMMDEGLDMRVDAALALGKMGAAMPERVQLALVAHLKNEDAHVREYVAMALDDVGTAMSETVQQALVASLADTVGEVRIATVRALQKLGTAMPETVQPVLVAHLNDVDLYVSKCAAIALGEMGAAMSATEQEALVARLRGPDETVAAGAAQALGRLGAVMPRWIQQVLMEQLEGKYESIDGLFLQWAAIEALGRLAEVMPVAVQQALVRRLGDSEVFLRREAVEGLGNMGAVMPETVQQALVASLADPAQEVRIAVVEALGKLGAVMPETVQQALVASLADPAQEVRIAVAGALGKSGWAMSESVQLELATLLTDKDLSVQEAMRKLLQSLCGAIPETMQLMLIARLRDRDSGLGLDIVSALVELGVAMSDAAQLALVEQFMDKGFSGEEVEPLLSGLGGAMSVAVQALLLTHVRDKDWTKRFVAVIGLTSLQQNGHRYYAIDRESMGPLVSDLSATAPFSDGCRAIPRGRGSAFLVC